MRPHINIPLQPTNFNFNKQRKNAPTMPFVLQFSKHFNVNVVSTQLFCFQNFIFFFFFFCFVFVVTDRYDKFFAMKRARQLLLLRALLQKKKSYSDYKAHSSVHYVASLYFVLFCISVFICLYVCLACVFICICLSNTVCGCGSRLATERICNMKLHRIHFLTFFIFKFKFSLYFGANYCIIQLELKCDKLIFGIF